MTATTGDWVDGLPIRVVGEGRPLVLLHGFTGSSGAWPAAAIERLADRRRIVLVDLPGHGRSIVDTSDATAFTVQRTVERLRSLAESPHATGADWMGYSMGGRLALLAAIDGVPMRSLLLESASAGIEEPESREARRRLDDELARKIIAEGVPAFVDRWIDLPLFATQLRLPAEVRSAERDRRLENDAAGLAAALRGFGTGRQPWVGGRLGELEIPVTLITGALDEKFDGISRVLESKLRSAGRRSIPGAGHAVHLEAPGRWTSEVTAHLDRVESNP